VTATIGERNGADADGAAQIHPAFEGAALSNAANNSGVLVESVADGSPAQQAGLRANDIVLAIGRVRVTNVDQLRQAVNGAQAFALTIRRGNSTLVFTIQ
jgi:S1-C subfamily serine protease